MALTWGQLKAIATAAALPDAAAVEIELDMPSGTVAPPVPGYVANLVSFRKVVESASVTTGKLVAQ